MNIREIVSNQHLDYDYFLNEAKSIVRELENKEQCITYLTEKMRHVQELIDMGREQ